MDSKRKKLLLKIGIALIVIAVIGLVSNSVTVSIMQNSYSTSKELRDDKPELIQVVNGKDKDEVLSKINRKDYKDIEDMSKACEENAIGFISINGSPYLKHLANSTYDVYKVKAGYTIIVKFEDYGELKILCSGVNAAPVTFIRDNEFSDEEKAFYNSIGKCWEVTLSDGTYSIQYR